MELAVRPVVTAGVALAAAGMIAVTPVTPALPTLQVPDIQLTAGISEDLQDLMLGFNTGLIGGLTDFNTGLVGGQLGLQDLLFGSDSALNGVVNRLFNVVNMGFGAGQNALTGLLGVNGVEVPKGITESLLVGLNPAGVFRGGDIGGLEGMLGNGLQAFANITGFPGEDMMFGLENGFLDLNKQLVAGFQDFNQFLVGGQIGLEQFIFGTDSALNGVINRSFNAFNMFLDAGQQGFLGLLGADFDSAALTSSLLVGLGSGNVFMDGAIGGLEGVLGNGYMALADLLGGLFDPAAMFGNLNLFGIFDPMLILNLFL